MKYCMKCGVAVDETKIRRCPLCNSPILTDEELEQLKVADIIPEQKPKPEKAKKEKTYRLGLAAFILVSTAVCAIVALIIIDLAIGFEFNFSLIPILSLLLFLITVAYPFAKPHRPLYLYVTFDAMAIVIYLLLLNELITKNISWSYYAVLSVVLVWVYASSALLPHIKNFVLRLSADFAATAIYVLLVTLGLNTHSAFSKLALPINALVFILTVIAYLFIKTYIYNWRVIVTTLSITLSILCVGIDLLLQNYLHSRFGLQWSYIVLLVLIPFTLFMFYLNNRYKIDNYLRKKFHI